MRTTIRLCLIASLVAAVGLTVTPIVNAQAPHLGIKGKIAKAKAASKKSEKKQNRGIQNAQDRADKAHERIENLKDWNQSLSDWNNSQEKSIDSVEGTVATILAGVPDIINGLTQLQAGLVSVGDVLQNTVAPGLTALQNGLLTLSGAYQAVEYGTAKVFAAGAATPTVAAGGQVVSADVPDDGNPIQAGDTAIVVAGATGAMTIDLRADIRSNESDNGVGATVGQAGAFVYVENLDTGVRVACSGTPNPPGIIGTLAGDSIVTPSGTVTNLPLKNLPGGVLRTDQTHPDGSSVNLLPASCGFGASIGTTYAVHYSVNFVDIPTSLTPGGTE